MDSDMNFEPFLLHMLRDENDESVKKVESSTTIKNHGTMSLHEAVKRGDVNLIKSLIDAECKVDVVDDDGNTPLILALTFSGEINTDKILIISTLLDTDANVLLTNKIGKSAVEILIRDSRVNVQIIMSKLLKKFKKECGNDSLLTAKKLLELNCLLSQAVNLKDITVTKCMLENGCDVNKRLSDHDFTALHWAALNSDVECVRLLLNYGADVDGGNYFYQIKPVDLLQFRFREDQSIQILKLLVNHGASLFDGFGNFGNDDFIRCGTKKFIKALIRICKLNFNLKLPSGETLLHLLASKDNFDSMEVLQGQKLKIKTIRYVYKEYCANTTALIQAASHSHVRTVEFLLKNGAQVNCTDYEQHSALSYAFYKTFKVGSKAGIDLNLMCIEILLFYGADTEWSNRHGDTLFDLVLESKNFKLIKPVLADLVLIEALGSELEDLILTKINSRAFFKNYFDFCKRKIEEIKKHMICSVSLFDILTESEEKIVDFTRNKGLVRKLESMAYSTDRSKLFYHKILRKRVAKLLEMANVREKAFSVLSRIQELRNNRLILEEIVDYFSYKNLQVIAKV